MSAHDRRMARERRQEWARATARKDRVDGLVAVTGPVVGAFGLAMVIADATTTAFSSIFAWFVLAVFFNARAYDDESKAREAYWAAVGVLNRGTTEDQYCARDLVCAARSMRRSR